MCQFSSSQCIFILNLCIISILLTNCRSLTLSHLIFIHIQSTSKVHLHFVVSLWWHISYNFFFSRNSWNMCVQCEWRLCFIRVKHPAKQSIYLSCHMCHRVGNLWHKLLYILPLEYLNRKENYGKGRQRSLFIFLNFRNLTPFSTFFSECVVGIFHLRLWVLIRCVNVIFNRDSLCDFFTLTPQNLMRL